ncbi:hypothetical protein GPJ56_006987 [Histomonas meleagridis]|uniref:uncharacterized protein n=1 Tax=Histomonas meleagridis TaxID=135588 RepID=UPI003559D4D8|nr:hypothetical protein GPJ56_006987 [Histomonas meleagridis]KAH0796706.1 hypothetical protein GO595_010599 [Histomonas meleagridis]
MGLSASRSDFYVVSEGENKNNLNNGSAQSQEIYKPITQHHYLVDYLVESGKWEELLQAILELNGSIPSELFSFTCEQLSKMPKSVLITVLDIIRIQYDILAKLRKHPSEEEISAIHECFNNVQEHSWVLSQFSNVVPLLPISILEPIFQTLLDFDKTTVKLPVAKIPPYATEYDINSFPFSAFKKRDDVLPVLLSVLEKSLKKDTHTTKLNILKDLNQKKIIEIRQMLIKVPFHEQHPDNVLSIITSNPKGVFYTLNQYLKKEELVNSYFLPACELELNGDSKQHVLKDLSIEMMTDNNLAFEVHKMRQLGGRYESFWQYLLKKLNENVIHYFIDLEQATLFQKVIDTLKPNTSQTFSLLSFDEAITIITNTINAVFNARESIVQVDVRKYSDLLLRLIPNLWATYQTFPVSSLSAFEGTRDGYRSVLNFIDQDLRDKLIAASVRDPLSDDFADWVKVAGVTALSAPILQLSSPRKTQLIIKDNDVTVDEHCFVTNSNGEKIHLSEYKILTCKFWESKTSLLDDGYEFLLRNTMELLIDSLFLNDKEYMKKAIDSHIRMCELLLKVYHSEKESFQMTLLSEVVCTPISMEVGSLVYGSKEYATLLFNKILQRMKFVQMHKVILSLICTSYCEELPHLDETASYVLELVLPYAQSIAKITGIQKNAPPLFTRVYPLNRTDYKTYVKNLVNALSKTKVSHIKIGETSQYQQIEVIDPKILLNYEEIMRTPKVRIGGLSYVKCLEFFYKEIQTIQKPVNSEKPSIAFLIQFQTFLKKSLADVINIELRQPTFNDLDVKIEEMSLNPKIELSQTNYEFFKSISNDYKIFSSSNLFELIKTLQLYDFYHGDDETILFDPPLITFKLNIKTPIAFEFRDKSRKLLRNEIETEAKLIQNKNQKTLDLLNAENNLRDFHSENELIKPQKISKPKYIETLLKPQDDQLIYEPYLKVAKALESIPIDQIFKNENLTNFVTLITPVLSDEFLIKLFETFVMQTKSRQSIYSKSTKIFQELCHKRRSSIWPKISEQFSLLCPLTEYDIHFSASTFDVFIRRALLNNDVELISKILSSPLFSNLIYTTVPQVIYSVKDRILFIKNLLDIAQSSNCKINENGLSSLVKLCLDNNIIGLVEAPQYCIDFITFAANNSNSLIVSQSIFLSVGQYYINLYNIGLTLTNSAKQLSDALEICYSKHPNELTVISGIIINKQIARRAIGMNQIISDMKVDINIDGFSNIKNGSNEWKSLSESFITKFVCQALNSSDSFMVEYAIEILPSINIEASALQETIIPFIINKLNGNSLLELSEQLFKFCVTLCASSDNSSLIDSFVSSFKSLQNEFNAIAKEQLMTILGNNNPITNVSLEWSRRSTKPYKIIGTTLNEEVVHKFKENKSNDLQRLSSICKKINETIQPLLVLTDNFVYFRDTVNVIGNEHFMNFAKALDNKSEALKHFLVLLGNETKVEFGNEIYNSLKSNFTIEHLYSISKWKNVRTEVKQMVTNEVKKCLSESSADSVLEIFTQISPILFGNDNQQQTRGKVIQVKTTTGRIIDVELEPGMSNAQLVAKIAQVQGIPESEVRVLDQGKQVNN